MIIHDIIKYKAPATVPWVYSPERSVPITQEELQKQVDHYSFQVGDFVTMAPLASSLYSVHCVMHIETDMKKVQQVLHKPAPLLLCQVDSASVTPWMRWDTFKDYRLLSEEEYTRLIGENSDNLRHYCLEKSKHLIPKPPVQENCCPV